MEVARLVLEYLRVVLNYPVTVLAVVIFFLVWFKEDIQRALGRLSQVTLPGGASATFKDYKKAVEPQISKEVEKAATKEVPASAFNVMVGLSRSLLRLVSDLLPLVPRAQRRRFIESLELPPEAEDFRKTLFNLADKAPELTSLRVGDVIRMSDEVRVELKPPPLHDEGKGKEQ